MTTHGQRFDCAIIGGGIVGLAVAVSVLKRQPGLRLVIIEKEDGIARHQTGRNSGVIHSGIYYKPGSSKAQFAKAGNRSMVEFCREHGLLYKVCGKVIVATEEKELPQLEELFNRGHQNGLEVERLSPSEVNEIEPHVACLAGLKVPTTGIVDYRQVCSKFAELIEKQGGIPKTGTRVESIREIRGIHTIETNRGAFETKFLINCAGLQSDRVARRSGLNPTVRIVPFRGEYYELIPEKNYLVNTLIYPVPNPAFPFLGVHFTRMIDGSVHAGPNAVLALKREGYHKTDIAIRDVLDTISYKGFWKLALKHWEEGAMEIYRSYRKAAFVRSLQRLIPEIKISDVVPSQAGVRAQALQANGFLVDDFLILNGRNSLHVCNAPSPAATASIEIGNKVAESLPNLTTIVTVGYGSA